MIRTIAKALFVLVGFAALLAVLLSARPVAGVDILLALTGH